MFDIMKGEIETVLEKEMDQIEVDKTINHIENLLSDEVFSKKLNRNINELVEETKERDKFICLCMMIGLGRNRTIEVLKLKNYEITRGIFEEVRDKLGLKDSDLRKENEKKITKIKWETKTRANRKKKLAHVSWADIKHRYVNGESPISIGKDYNVSGHLITEQLKEENLFDYNRSTITKNKIAKDKENEIDDKFISQLMKNNPLMNMNKLWRKAQKEYPWLLRKQFLDKVDEMGLTRSKSETNKIRSLKSKRASNTSYQVKVNGYRAVKEVFGSDEELTKQYMEGSAGSYSNIADKINKEISFEHEISVKQVERIIRNSPNYKSRTSIGQHQLYTFIKNTFKSLEVIQEYVFNGGKRIDIYIPELNIGFEFNGDYWHSNAMIEHNYGMQSYDFHKQRVDEASELGIKVLYVWENDWNNNRETIRHLITNHEWENQIFHKYESDLHRSFKKSEARSKLFDVIIGFLEDENIDYSIDTDNNEINIEDLFVKVNTNTRF